MEAQTLHSRIKVDALLSHIKAGFDFLTEYEGVALQVHYDALDDSDERGPWTTVDVVAVTVPGGKQDLTVVLDSTVTGTMLERARDDYTHVCRRARTDFAVQLVLDARAA